jgi:hypothetical protein
LPTPLRFSVPRLYIGKEASSGGCQGLLTHRGAARGWAAPPWCEAGPWPPSGSLSVLVLCLGKIRLLELVSFNSENISCVAFLKHKNSRKQETDTVVSCQ